MQNPALVVFIFPVVISLFFGTFVMAEVLKEPERELNMWPFKFSTGGGIIQSEGMKITGLASQYSTSQAIEIEVSILDPTFDCGDLYITIYDLGHPSKQVVTQSGYFDQCYQKNNQKLPMDDEFSETIESPGQYEILIEMKDKSYKKMVFASEKFTVK